MAQLASPSPSPSAELFALLPFNLQELLALITSDLAESLIQAATNTFFAPITTGSTGETTRIGLRTGEQGCWDRLPFEWRVWFDGIARGDARESLLEQLANGDCSAPDMPPTLQAYLLSCRRNSLDRTCSPIPILSYPPRPPPSPSPPPTPPAPTALHGQPGKKQKQPPSSRAGQSPKKAHEVDQFSALVRAILEREEEQGAVMRPTHVIDVGSGRAHLSRALASPPLNLQVLAVDWSATQTSGAEYLGTLKPRIGKTAASVVPEAEEGAASGSLTHMTSSLDALAIEELMRNWPPAVGDKEEGQAPAMLVALHACGDLTIDSIKAFLSSATTSSSLSPYEKKRTAILCGCCYNLQTPSLFPLSSLASSSALMTRQHLLLTAHSPLNWYLPTSSPSSPPGSALQASVLKLAHRARLEAELAHAGMGSEGERRVGRVGHCPGGWGEYRAKALARYGAAEVGELEFQGGEGRGWEDARFRLQVFWTLKSWLGPVLESLLLVDRWCFLVEGLRDAGEWSGGEGEGRRVEVVNLFEQGTGSLRNLALVVR